jgi:hypothetical protein
MLHPEKKEADNTTYTFSQAETIFAAEMPAFIKSRALQNPEAEAAKREFIYHFIAAKLTDEKGILEGDPETTSDHPVITKTLVQWHELWAEALKKLLS